MKVRIGKGLVLLTGLVLSNASQAASHDVERAAGAAAGIFAGIYVHELGHAAAFRAAGAEEIRIRVPGTQCSLLCGETQAAWRMPLSLAQGRMINAAGFIASNLAAELMLQHESSARSGFGQGFIATNLYSNAAHVFTYYTKIRGRNGYRGNDIDAYELTGGNPHLLSAGLIAYSVYTLHRARKKEISILFMRVPF